jgi:hypothetical protein
MDPPRLTPLPGCIMRRLDFPSPGLNRRRLFLRSFWRLPRLRNLPQPSGETKSTNKARESKDQGLKASYRGSEKNTKQGMARMTKLQLSKMHKMGHTIIVCSAARLLDVRSKSSAPSKRYRPHSAMQSRRTDRCSPRQILHQDIFENNITITCPKTADGFTGKLIDLDPAMVDGERTGLRHQVGTRRRSSQ